MANIILVEFMQGAQILTDGKKYKGVEKNSIHLYIHLYNGIKEIHCYALCALPHWGQLTPIFILFLSIIR